MAKDLNEIRVITRDAQALGTPDPDDVQAAGKPYIEAAWRTIERQARRGGERAQISIRGGWTKKGKAFSEEVARHVRKHFEDCGFRVYGERSEWLDWPVLVFNWHAADPPRERF